MAETINSLEEWNTILGGCAKCCEMPVVDEPEPLCESITVEACGYSLPDLESVPDEDKCKLFQTKTDRALLSATDGGDLTDNRDTSTVYKVKFEDSEEGRVCLEGWDSTVWSQTSTNTGITTTFNSSSSTTSECSGTSTITDGEGSTSDEWNVCDMLDLSPDGDWSYAGGVFTKVIPVSGPDGTDTQTVSFTDQVDRAALVAEIDYREAGAGDEPWEGSSCTASLVATKTYAEPVGEDPPELACSQISEATRARVQFKVPFSHKGTAFQLDGDTLFTPADGGDPVLTALDTLVWTGPGNPADADDDNWLTDFWTIEVPDEEGEVELVNVRFTHMPSNPAGVKPQLHSGFATYVAP